MNIIIKALTEALINMAIFTSIPLIFYIINKNNESFFSYIGLKKVQLKSKKIFFITFTSLILLSLALSSLFKYIPQLSQHSATANIEGVGIVRIIVILIFSFIKTGLAEEIFFRGFLAKRLIGKFGFKTGNLLQATIFGLLHGLLFLQVVSVPLAALITLLTTFNAIFSVWINEKQAGGSILPSYVLHSISNVIACLAF